MEIRGSISNTYILPFKILFDDIFIPFESINCDLCFEAITIRKLEEINNKNILAINYFMKSNSYD